MAKRFASALLIGCLGWTSAASAGYPPTTQEQYMLELVNRLRLAPDAEVYRLRNETWGDQGSPAAPDLNEGITSNPLPHTSGYPLTFNQMLIQSARDYSQTLLDHDDFQHNYGGTTPGSRMTAAGYDFSGGGTWGENLALVWSSGSLAINAARVDAHYKGLFIDGNVPGRGHRRNLLYDGFREVGIGIQVTTSASYTPPGYTGNFYALITTQDFATSASSSGGLPFLTGVVHADSTDNDFYSTGEGLGGVTVTAAPVSGGSAASTTTWSSGGYTLPLVAGTYNITFSGGGLTSPVTYSNVRIGSNNVKLDATTTLGVWNADGNGNWSTGGNWSGIQPNGAGQVAAFMGKATTARSVTVDANRTVSSILFDNAAAGYSLTGSGTLTLQLSGDRTRIFDYSGSHGISAPMNLATGVDVTVLAGSDSLALTGAISNSGTQSVVKFGKGTLRLAGSNTFAGGLTITDGTVLAGHSKALGSGTATLGFGTADAALRADTAVTITNPILVASGSGGTRTLGTTLTSGTATFSGPVTLNHDLVLDAPAGGRLVLSGVLTNTSSNTLTKTGTGTLVLKGSETNSAGSFLRVTAGSLELDTNTGGSLNLVLSGSGTTVLLNTSQNFASLTVGNGAKLVFGSSFSTAPLPEIALDGQASPVPEPGTLAMFAAGAIVCVAVASRSFLPRRTIVRTRV